MCVLAINDGFRGHDLTYRLELEQNTGLQPQTAIEDSRYTFVQWYRAFQRQQLHHLCDLWPCCA